MLADRIKIEQTLGRMLVGAIPGIDDRTLNVPREQLGRPGGRVADIRVDARSGRVMGED